MHAATPTGAVGENIATLRKTADWSQAKLAREAGISTSYLKKIEIGDRACRPAIAASIANALGVTLALLYGQPYSETPVPPEKINALRSAVRRYAQPITDQPYPEDVHELLERATNLRAATRYRELLDLLPDLVGQATAHAHSADDPAGWLLLVDVYGCAYTVAHRLGYPDLAELVTARQAWAAHQTWNPMAVAAAAWSEAGTFQSAGDYTGGLSVIEDAITRMGSYQADSVTSAVALGSLHLRGVTLASRARDATSTADHLRHARHLADQLPADRGDILDHNLTFGAGNVDLHEMASWVELEKPAKAVTMADRLASASLPGLTPTRTGHLHIDSARARLAAGQRDEAVVALFKANKVAPQMALIHPMAREVTRVLVSLHRRSNPELSKLARQMGMAE